MIKNIAFDCGGVLVFGNGFATCFLEGSGLEITENEFWKHLKLMEIGQASINELAPKLGSLWISSLETNAEYNRQLADFLLDLPTDIGFGIISNVDEALSKTNINENVYKKFDPVVLSYKYKTVKPQKKIFDVYLNLVNLNANEVLFIDNNKEYVNAALSYGFNAFQFVDNADTIDRINNLL